MPKHGTKPIIHTHGSPNGLFIDSQGASNQSELFSVDRMSEIKRNYNITCVFMTACSTAASNGSKNNFACAISKKISPKGIVIASKYKVSGASKDFTSKNNKGKSGWVIYRDGKFVQNISNTVLTMSILYDLLKRGKYI